MGLDFTPIFNLLGLLPIESLEPRFMRRALFALLLLSPMTSMLGSHVINFRMAFFSDAVGHSAFAGLAVGLILGVSPPDAALLFGTIVGIFIMAVQRRSGLSADAAIGVVFSAVVAFGLAIVSRAPNLARDVQQYLYGDILTVGENELTVLLVLLIALCFFEYFGWNKLLSLSLSPSLAKVNGISAGFWQYAFAGLLALVVMFSVRAVGVLLVTAMLVVPASCGRKMARNMRGVFWWTLFTGVFSSVAGLILSAQDWMATASGATIIIVACGCFAVSCVWAAARDAIFRS